jgi:antitoxin MazE
LVDPPSRKKQDMKRSKFNLAIAPLRQVGALDALGRQNDSGRIEKPPLKRNPREGWAADSQRIAQAGDDALVWPEFASADDKDLKW